MNHFALNLRNKIIKGQKNLSTQSITKTLKEVIYSLRAGAAPP